MELGLSLGDTTTSKTFDGFLAKASDGLATTTATAAATASAMASSRSLGLCMTLGINSSNGTDHHQADEDDCDDDDDDDDDDEENTTSQDQETLIQKRIQEISSLNPPVQLDLLPLAPVPRQTPLPWSSDNGSSEGGSSGNAPAGRGLEVNGRLVAMAAGTEEATSTSSFRLDFGSYSRNNGNNNSNKKRDFETRNDAVEVERGSSRASDEDENGLSRKKLRLSKEQSAFLEESFKEQSTLNPKQKLALAKQLNLRPRQVEVWFQNRRARTKLKQTEMDCEYLKRCCETLTEENRRLHKELQELRALKSPSNPFYMQLPATTLTMCPSCERIATTSTATNTSNTTAPPPSSAAATTKRVDPPAASNGKPSSSSTTTTPFLLSSKARPFYTVTHAPPPSNKHHQPAAPS